MKALPDGSAYVAATDASRSWSDERTMCADVYDMLLRLWWWFALDKEKVDEPPSTVRPADVARAREAEERHRRARKTLESARREEVR